MHMINRLLSLLNFVKYYLAKIVYFLNIYQYTTFLVPTLNDGTDACQV